MMPKNTEQLHLQDLADTTVINPVDANGARGLEGLGTFPPAGGDGFAGFTADGGDEMCIRDRMSRAPLRSWMRNQ